MAEGSLGILVTRHEGLARISGIVRAARTAGHRVRIFLNDEGVRFSREAQFLDLLGLGGVEVAVCDHFCEKLGIADRSAGITYGSQYDNALMLHHCDRVLVF